MTRAENQPGTGHATRSDVGDDAQTPSVAGGSAWLFGTQLVANAGFFVAVLLIARGLGPAGRGTIAFITVTALVVGRATKVGVTEATTVFAAQRPAQRATLLTNLIVFTLVGSGLGTLLVCGGLILAAAWRPAGIGSMELLALAFAIMANALVVAGNAFLLGCGRVRARSILTAIGPWLYAGIVAASWYLDRVTVTRAAFAFAVAEAVWAAALLIISVRAARLARASLSLLRESIAFGLRAWIGTLSAFANARADQILMGFMVSEATLGIYAVAVNGAEMLLYLSQATASALLPVLSRDSLHRGKERSLRVFRSMLLITLGSMLVAAAVGPSLVPLVFGHAYDASTTPYLLLLPGAVGFAATSVFSSSLLAASWPGRSSIGPMVSLAVGLGLDLLLIPGFGASGAAIASSAALLAGGAVCIVLYRNRSPFPWKQLCPTRRDVAELLLLTRKGRPRATPCTPANTRGQPGAKLPG
jgi:O-antigen/teichoic acid export membrane protein